MTDGLPRSASASVVTFVLLHSSSFHFYFRRIQLENHEPISTLIAVMMACSWTNKPVVVAVDLARPCLYIFEGYNRLYLSYFALYQPGLCHWISLYPSFIPLNQGFGYCHWSLSSLV